MITWSIRTTKPQKISACMIPAGCSPVRNFLWPSPSTTARWMRSGTGGRPRRGQGVVTAAELLSVAAFLEGRHAQAFPSFGSERTGAPVVAFCRIDDRADPRARADRRARRADRPGPDAAAPGRRVRGLGPDGYVLINHRAQLRRARARRARRAFRRERVLTVPATELAREHLGRPLPNAALLGGFAALTRRRSRSTRWPRRSASEVPGPLADGNVAAAEAALRLVARQIEEEPAHA